MKLFQGVFVLIISFLFGSSIYIHFYKINSMCLGFLGRYGMFFVVGSQRFWYEYLTKWHICEPYGF